MTMTRVNRHWFQAALYALGALALSVTQGCVSSGTDAEVTSGQGSASIDEAQAVSYNGPKARIAVTQFTDKTGKGWYSADIGRGMADMMTTALVNSNRYIVLERQQVDSVLREQDFGASGRVREETAAPIGQIEGAELLITGAVTGFEGNAAGTQGSVSGSRSGGGGLLGNVIGGISGGYQKAYMAIDVRVIDSRTSRIVAATTVEAEATDVNLGGLAGGFGSAGSLAGSLSGWKNTPTEKALRICIKKAVEFVVSKTPDTYYHYNAQGQRIDGGGSQAAASSGGGAGSGGETVTVKPDTLNVRSGPGTDYAVTASVHGGDRLEVLERQDEWVRIRTNGGAEGWVAGWLVN